MKHLWSLFFVLLLSSCLFRANQTKRVTPPPTEPTVTPAPEVKGGFDWPDDPNNKQDIKTDYVTGADWVDLNLHGADAMLDFFTIEVCNIQRSNPCQRSEEASDQKTLLLPQKGSYNISVRACFVNQTCKQVQRLENYFVGKTNADHVKIAAKVDSLRADLVGAVRGITDRLQKMRPIAVKDNLKPIVTSIDQLLALTINEKLVLLSSLADLIHGIKTPVVEVVDNGNGADSTPSPRPTLNPSPSPSPTPSPNPGVGGGGGDGGDSGDGGGVGGSGGHGGGDDDVDNDGDGGSGGQTDNEGEGSTPTFNNQLLTIGLSIGATVAGVGALGFAYYRYAKLARSKRSVSLEEPTGTESPERPGSQEGGEEERPLPQDDDNPRPPEDPARNVGAESSEDPARNVVESSDADARVSARESDADAVRAQTVVEVTEPPRIEEGGPLRDVDLENHGKLLQNVHRELLDIKVPLVQAGTTAESIVAAAREDVIDTRALQTAVENRLVLYRAPEPPVLRLMVPTHGKTGWAMILANLGKLPITYEYWMPKSAGNKPLLMLEDVKDTVHQVLTQPQDSVDKELGKRLMAINAQALPQIKMPNLALPVGPDSGIEASRITEERLAGASADQIVAKGARIGVQGGYRGAMLGGLFQGFPNAGIENMRFYPQNFVKPIKPAHAVPIQANQLSHLGKQAQANNLLKAKGVMNAGDIGKLFAMIKKFALTDDKGELKELLADIEAYAAQIFETRNKIAALIVKYKTK